MYCPKFWNHNENMTFHRLVHKIENIVDILLFITDEYKGLPLLLPSEPVLNYLTECMIKIVFWGPFK